MFRKNEIDWENFAKLSVEEGKVALLWFNEYSGIAIKTASKTIVVDPVGIKGSEISPDILLISHEHFDHYDRKVVNRMRSEKTTLIASKEISIDGKLLGPGEEVEEEEIKIKALPSVHPSGVPLTFLLKVGEIKIYHATDSQTYDGMKELRDENIDIAIVPIGIAPGVSPSSGAKAIEYIRPKVAIPHHSSKGFDDFKAESERLAPETKVVILERGEIYTYPS